MISFLFGLSIVTFSQTRKGTMCATDGNFPDVLKSTNLRTQSSARIANSCFYTVRVFFHLVRNTDGTGGQDVGIINTIMTNLTNAYTPHSIFFLNSGNDQIRNSYYMTAFDSQVKFSQLITVNSVSNAINVYLLDNNTFNAGKASGIPGNSLVIGGNYSVNGVVQNLVPSLVVAHEMGHCLGGYHTFETLTNGAELVNRSNCTSAGDLVCDTPAESPNYNFTENTACNWTTNFTDSNGQTYSPALNNIMDYIRPSCMQLFTAGQGTRMRSVLSTSAVFDNIIVDPIINGPSLICSTGNSNFSIDNLPAGFTVSWSSSNPAGLSINATTGAATRVNNFNGPVTISATISGGCGSVNVAKNVWVGNPEITGSISGSSYATCANTYIYSLQGGINGSSSWIWQASDHFTKSTSGSNYFLTPIYSGEGYVSVEASNICGNTNSCLTICADGCDTGLLVFPGSHPCYTSGQCGFSLMSVYPNPSSGGITIKTNLALDKTVTKNLYEVVVHDEKGHKILNQNMDKEEFIIDKGVLKTGTYYVKIYLQGKLMDTKRVTVN